MALLLLVSISTTYADNLGPVSTQVAEVKVRTAPNFWSAPVASASYGDEVTAVAEDGSWLKVKTRKGASGFLPASAVTTKKVVLTSRGGKTRGGVDDVDAILAGKGFNSDIEASLQSSGASLNYPAVERLERTNVSQGELLAFVKKGGLIEGKVKR